MKLAVFDIDGTLVRPNPIEAECFIGAFRTAFGIDDVSPNWASYSQNTDTGIINEVCLGRRSRPASIHELGTFRRHYAAAFLSRHQPGEGTAIDGACEFLARLRADPDWTIAIATGNFLALALHKLRHAGLRCLDVPMATADDSMSRGALIRRAIAESRKAAGVNGFEHVVYVGDQPWDLHAARETGLPFLAVGVACGATPDRMIADYVDGEQALDRLKRAICW